MTVVADRETGRWAGVAAVALFAVAVALLVSRPAPLLAGSLAVVVAAAVRFSSPPSPDLVVERELSTTDPEPEAPVRVTLSVRNDGDGTLPDLRVIDGVPDGARVTVGSPRLGTALRPGATARIEYTVRPTRGRHEFEPATVLARGYTGAHERELAIDPDGPAVVTARPRLQAGAPMPLRAQATPFAGRLATDEAGEGIEFHSVREYRAGDALSRVDWRRVARTGEVATVQFRQERAASVVLVVDTREAAYVAASTDAPGGPNGLVRSATAAGEAFGSLLAAGDRVGLTAFGPEDAWLAPGTGEPHRARAAELLGTATAFSLVPSEDSFFAWLAVRRLRRRLPDGSQVVLFSPLADDYVVELVRRIDAYGHPVTVVSPDPTGDATPGQQLARIERSARLSTLRRAGVRVIDWGDEPLATAVAAARRRWSR